MASRFFRMIGGVSSSCRAVCRKMSRFEISHSRLKGHRICSPRGGY